MKRNLRLRRSFRWLREKGAIRGFHFGGNWRGALNIWAHANHGLRLLFFRKGGLTLSGEKTTHVDLSAVDDSCAAWAAASRAIARLPGWEIHCA